MTSSKLCFFAQYIFSLACNDPDIWKTHLNKAEQIIKQDFYLRLQNTENLALRASIKSYLGEYAVYNFIKTMTEESKFDENAF